MYVCMLFMYVYMYVIYVCIYVIYVCYLCMCIYVMYVCMADCAHVWPRVAGSARNASRQKGIGWELPKGCARRVCSTAKVFARASFWCAQGLQLQGTMTHLPVGEFVQVQKCCT